MNLIPRSFYDDMFDNFLTSNTNRFKCDIYEKDNNYYIEMDVPGFSKEDLNIECNNGYLTIKISKNNQNNDENKNYIRKERTVSEYQRTFYVGNVDTENISATFNNGILIINLPKKEEIATKKTIEID